MTTKGYTCPHCGGTGKREDMDGNEWACNNCGGAGQVSSAGRWIPHEDRDSDFKRKE